MGKPAFHLIMVGYYFFAMWYDQKYVDLDIPQFKIKNDMKFFKGRLKFLTIWNMVSAEDLLDL